MEDRVCRRDDLKKLFHHQSLGILVNNLFLCNVKLKEENNYINKEKKKLKEALQKLTKVWE